MNPNTATGSRSLWRRRPRLFQDLALLGAKIRFSRRSRRNSSHSSLLRPGALPSSTSTWRLQFRNDCGETPSSFDSCGIERPLEQQAHGLGSELPRIRRDSRHRQTSSPASHTAQSADVHQNGGTPHRHTTTAGSPTTRSSTRPQAHEGQWKASEGRSFGAGPGGVHAPPGRFTDRWIYSAKDTRWTTNRRQGRRPARAHRRRYGDIQHPRTGPNPPVPAPENAAVGTSDGTSEALYNDKTPAVAGVLCNRGAEI
jgi:hypothetical protein